MKRLAAAAGLVLLTCVVVRAGRMKPEFYEWSVPRGILK